MLRLFATPKTRPTFAVKTCSVIRGMKLNSYKVTTIPRIAKKANCRGDAPACRPFHLGKRCACPATVERDGNRLMITRLLCSCAFLLSIVDLLPAQETP